MTIRTQLLDAILAHCNRRGVAETTFGRHAVNDGKFVGRLRRGDNIGINTIERVEEYIAYEAACPDDNL